jgi:hypothetical protein
MYCQWGFGSRMIAAARVSHGRIRDLESAENMKRGYRAANSLMRATASSNESVGLK